MHFKLMKTPTVFIGLRALCPLATALLITTCGNAATPDTAPARSVKNLDCAYAISGIMKGCRYSRRERALAWSARKSLISSIQPR